MRCNIPKNLIFVVMMMMMMKSVCVRGHGYLSWPAARQFKCYRDNNFWWPETGETIPDEACRAAYQTVYAKYRNSGKSHGVAANAAQYMFQQYYEYAALAGPAYNDLEYLKERVIPNHLCAAGAENRSHTFGDKSGMDEPLDGLWRAETLYPTVEERTQNDGASVVLHFCPTTEHDPSFFQVFITRPDYDYSHKLDWDDLELLDNDGPSALVENDGSDEACVADRLYQIPVTIPFRHEKFVLFVRWQRNDVVGEGFYNCADVIFNSDHVLKYKRARAYDRQHQEL
ncbi:gp37 [Artaxa digramma nucleopolyhedrovirus]|uniref:Gp37 n=1 Tax=Artaxa digramma nucleopolyhedrovirus TaxID=3070910 RepID=A0AAE6R7F0_9ABAC|nr:gp37 [Euproctis digramma nucleopolyhedrovirus]QHB21678.1 gp37 [Artaxa digramma nucleopolyhedrovirus]